MRDFGMILRFVIWFVAVVFGICLPGASYCQDDPAGDDLRANKLTNVKSHPLDHLSGSMALHALSSALNSQGVPTRYLELVSMSGAVFKFVYDSTEAYEPLRDSCPFDLLRTAAARNWFPDAHWETGRTIEDVKTIIKHEIDSGRPLVSPFLVPEVYHGFNVIAGYDYDQGILFIQGAFDTRRSMTIPIPDTWDGPTVSPAGWASNPVFVLGEPAEDSTDIRTIYIEMLTEGIELLAGGRLEYGRHKGEWRYMRSPGPREAWYGLPAYEILVVDVEDGRLLMGGSDSQVLNFGLVWRIDAMVGLLEHDRTYGAQFASLVRGYLSERQSWTLHELVSNFERTREDAALLRNMFWHEVPGSLISAEDVLAYADTARAMVFKLPDRDGLQAQLESLGREVYECPWGTVVVEDSRKRRLAAKLMAISIMSRERKSVDLMTQIVEFMEARKDVKWPPRGWKPREQRQN